MEKITSSLDIADRLSPSTIAHSPSSSSLISSYGNFEGSHTSTGYSGFSTQTSPASYTSHINPVHEIARPQTSTSSSSHTASGYGFGSAQPSGSTSTNIKPDSLTGLGGNQPLIGDGRHTSSPYPVSQSQLSSKTSSTNVVASNPEKSGPDLRSKPVTQASLASTPITEKLAITEINSYANSSLNPVVSKGSISNPDHGIKLNSQEIASTNAISKNLPTPALQTGNGSIANPDHGIKLNSKEIASTNAISKNLPTPALQTGTASVLSPDKVNGTSSLFPSNDQEKSLVAPSIRTSRGGNSYVFIDANVADYQNLVSGVERGSHVYVIGSEQNGIDSISSVLEGATEVSSLSIIADGDTGNFWLGNTFVDSNSLSQHSDEISAWQRSLTPDADILLYSCNLAADATGQLFVQQLSLLTGADVAASINRTGSSAIGNDWNLEYQTGRIESSPALTTNAMQSYNHSLAVFTVTNTDDSGQGSLREMIDKANWSSGGPDTILFNLGAGAHTIDLTSGQLFIREDLRIQGPGTDRLTISGNNQSRVIFIQQSDVDIARLTIANGLAMGGNGGLGGGAGGGGMGGGIFVNGGNVRLNYVDFLNNQAIGGHGGNFFSYGGFSGGGGGGMGGNGGDYFGTIDTFGGGGGGGGGFGSNGFTSGTSAGGWGGDSGEFVAYGGVGGTAGGIGGFNLDGGNALIGGGGGGGSGGGSGPNRGKGGNGGFGAGGGAGGSGIANFVEDFLSRPRPDGGDGGFGGGGGGGGGGVVISLDPSAVFFNGGNGGNGGFGGGGGGGRRAAIGGNGGLFGGKGGDSGGGGGGGAGLGGAIFVNAGTLSIRNSFISGNAAVEGGVGGVGIDPSANGQPGQGVGGAIFANTGTQVNILNSVFQDNSATSFGDDVYSFEATTKINNSTTAFQNANPSGIPDAGGHVDGSADIVKFVYQSAPVVLIPVVPISPDPTDPLLPEVVFPPVFLPIVYPPITNVISIPNRATPFYDNPVISSGSSYTPPTVTQTVEYFDPIPPKVDRNDDSGKTPIVRVPIPDPTVTRIPADKQPGFIDSGIPDRFSDKEVEIVSRISPQSKEDKFISDRISTLKETQPDLKREIFRDSGTKYPLTSDLSYPTNKSAAVNYGSSPATEDYPTKSVENQDASEQPFSTEFAEIPQRSITVTHSSPIGNISLGGIDYTSAALADDGFSGQSNISNEISWTGLSSGLVTMLPEMLLYFLLLSLLSRSGNLLGDDEEEDDLLDTYVPLDEFIDDFAEFDEEDNSPSIVLNPDGSVTMPDGTVEIPDVIPPLPPELPPIDPNLHGIYRLMAEHYRAEAEHYRILRENIEAGRVIDLGITGVDFSFDNNLPENPQPYTETDDLDDFIDDLFDPFALELADGYIGYLEPINDSFVPIESIPQPYVPPRPASTPVFLPDGSIVNSYDAPPNTLVTLADGSVVNSNDLSSNYIPQNTPTNPFEYAGNDSTSRFGRDLVPLEIPFTPSANGQTITGTTFSDDTGQIIDLGIPITLPGRTLADLFNGGRNVLATPTGDGSWRVTDQAASDRATIDDYYHDLATRYIWDFPVPVLPPPVVRVPRPLPPPRQPSPNPVNRLPQPTTFLPSWLTPLVRDPIRTITNLATNAAQLALRNPLAALAAAGLGVRPSGNPNQSGNWLDQLRNSLDSTLAHIANLDNSRNPHSTNPFDQAFGGLVGLGLVPLNIGQGTWDLANNPELMMPLTNPFGYVTQLGTTLSTPVQLPDLNDFGLGIETLLQQLSQSMNDDPSVFGGNAIGNIGTLFLPVGSAGGISFTLDPSDISRVREAFKAGYRSNPEAGSISLGGSNSFDLNWSFKSTKTFGHTFLDHGAGTRNTQRLLDRANTLGQSPRQGQWLDNEAATQQLRSLGQISGPVDFRIPEGIGQIIHADGSITSTTYARAIPKPGGGFKTAFPIFPGD